jgi:hypothetical protein
MVRKSNTWMGLIRQENRKSSTNSLIKRYNNMNTEGRKAAYDELRARGRTRDANLLRYRRLTKPSRRSSAIFGSRSGIW